MDNGTSYAAPMVSGVVSLMLAVAPGLSASQVRTVLASSAKPFPAGLRLHDGDVRRGHRRRRTPPLQAAQAIDDLATNFGGLWWNSPGGSESGWGINFAHQGDQIFASWFTYDLNGKAWWLVMSANRIAHRVYTGTLFQGTGPAFDTVPFPPLGAPAAQPARRSATATLTFSDANNGTFAYTVNGIAQTKAITRETFGPLPTCVFGAQANLALTSNYQDLWWAAPAGSEAGWGINLAHEGDTIFATWYTYDHDRSPMWLVTTANKSGLSSYTGDLIAPDRRAAVQRGPVPADRQPRAARRQRRRHGDASASSTATRERSATRSTASRRPRTSRAKYSPRRAPSATEDAPRARGRVAGAKRSSRISGALVANCSSCGCAGIVPCSLAWRITRAISARPIGASARSHSSRAVSPFLTKHQSCAAIAPASIRSAR